MIYDKSLKKLSTYDKCYKIRFHPFDYVHSDIVVRLDASIEIKKSLRPLIDKFNEGNYDKLAMIHPTRNKMADEYAAWVTQRKYPKSEAVKCIEMMLRLGYDADYKGIFESTFEIQRNNEINNQINNLVYDFLRYLGNENGIQRINQTIVSFVINKLFSDRIKILPVSESIITNSPYMQWYAHNSNHKLKDLKNKITPYMFNNPVELWDFKEGT